MRERRRGDVERRGGDRVVRGDGPLIGLHNIDSITGEFFAALRASGTLALDDRQRETGAEKERDKGW